MLNMSCLQSSQRGMERRIVAQLFDSIDYISALGKEQVSEAGAAANSGSGSEDAKATEGAAGEPTPPESKPKNGIVVLIVATNK